METFALPNFEEQTNYFSSDDDVNPKEHKKLLQAVSRIGKTQFIKKPSRSEPILAQDEFHLVKSTTESLGKIPDAAVNVNDLVRVLNKTNKHLTVGKELRNSRKNKKVLPQPLEKPVAERIRRTIGYEKLQKDLSKWDAVVARNRIAEQQVFPLNFEEIHVNIQENQKPPEIKIKSALRREFEAIEAECKAERNSNATEKDGNEKELPELLTKENLIARKKELAYLRIRESQKSAKARYQNKIKSKRYHKLIKRQKLREQLKEFEILQKENPEQALEKLEKLEKNRVLERASLRHKNTGTWAKNLQVRAKYDRDVRKDLADQLAVSKELTEKPKIEDEDESEEDSNEQATGVIDPFNPWSMNKKPNEVADFVSGYRKYWLERNENTNSTEKFKHSTGADDEEGLKDSSILNNESILSGEENESFYTKDKNSDRRKTMRIGVSKKKLQHRKSGAECISKQKKLKTVSGWVEEDCTENIKKPKQLRLFNEKVLDIDDIFDDAENLVQEKVASKLQKLSSAIKPKEYRKLLNNSHRNKRDHLDLSFKQQATRPEFDEQLTETPANTDNAAEETKTEIAKAVNTFDNNVPDKHVDHIDPEIIPIIKAKTFQTDLTGIAGSGDFLDDCDNEEDAMMEKQLTLAEVFEDDDFETDFKKEREDERKKNSTDEIDLTLPGWGSWAGCGISKAKQKNRFVLKFPKAEKRRDENKEKVYINEDANKKLKQHLVSDLPFPFTSVKDYEASIRAPIGPDFVPETAFRMLSRPSVITKMGYIIEPMDKDILVKPPKRPRTVVDARIENLNKKK